ncbi:MAG: hypothetical protein JW829_13235 [Pirellulales bacterium]|nr:hypothetical protein [Pirellulales bacterium]
MRGHHANDPIQDILRGFLSGQRFHVLADGQIQSPKSRLPKGYLPPGPWQPLREWMAITLPMAALPGRTNSRVHLSLVPCESMSDPTVLMTQIEPWFRYGTEAPQVRLEPLRFAMNAHGDILIQGHPLPSMEGRRFVVTEQIAVPAGWTWYPAVDGSI